MYFLAALRLCCHTGTFSGCSERALCLVAARGSLAAVAPLVGSAGSGTQAQQLGHTG